jgi:hypothetical protein
MVEENKQLASRIDGDILSAQEDVSVLRGELADTNRRLEELAVASSAVEDPSDPEIISSPQHAITETTSTPASNPSPSTSQQDEISPEPEPVAGCSSDIHHPLIRGGQYIPQHPLSQHLNNCSSDVDRREFIHQSLLTVIRNRTKLDEDT